MKNCDTNGERRAWLLGAAVAGMNLLASFATGEEMEDIRESFCAAAAVWAEMQNDEPSPSQRPALRLVRPRA